MSRPSASGTPFLVLRPETGKFAYWRNLRPEVARTVIGPIFASWLLKTHDLVGKSVVKISLKTGDKQLAQRRWLEIHPQVEAIVNAATAATKRALTPSMATFAPGLTSGDRATIAAQARHDLLAQADEAWVDPNFMTPLARGLEAALRARDNGLLPALGSDGGAYDYFTQYLAAFPANMSKEEIREWARAKEAEQVSKALNSGNLSAFDGPNKTLEFEEVKLGANAGTKAETFAIEMPSELTQRLSENGLEVGDEGERRRLAHAVLMAKAAAYQDIDARKNGKPIETPPRPAPLASEANDEKIPTMLEMHVIWADRTRPEEKSKDDNKLYVERFVAMHGDLRVDQIKRRHVREFRDMLLKFPRAMPDAIAKRPLKDILTWAERQEEEEQRKPEDQRKQIFLSRVTVNGKGIGSISALMTLANTEYDLSGDPCADLQLPVDERDVLQRRPFSVVHLGKMRTSPVFRNPPRVTKGGCGAAAYWMPLIALYTGARLEEIGQLPMTDILKEGEIEYFWFRTTEDEDEDDDRGKARRRRRRGAPKKEDDKSLKTAAGRRRVPFHRVLLELGFLDYIAARRAAGDMMLFPLLKIYRGRWTKNFSRYWARYQDKYMTEDPARVFHSFRHGFIDALRQAGIRKEYIKAIVGHARELEETREEANDVTEDYGNAYNVKLLNDLVQKVAYHGIEFERIEAFQQ